MHPIYESFCPEKLALAYRIHMGIHVAGYFPSLYQLTDTLISCRYKHCRSMMFMRSYFLTLPNVIRRHWFTFLVYYLLLHFIAPTPLSKPSFWFLVFWVDLKLWCRGRNSWKFSTLLTVLVLHCLSGLSINSWRLPCANELHSLKQHSVQELLPFYCLWMCNFFFH